MFGNVFRQVFFYFVVETIDLTIMDNSVKDILIHRTNVMKDLIQEFKDKEIINYNLNLRVIASNGALEKGEGIGVTREILALFWQSFLPLWQWVQKKNHCTGFVVWIH